mgnify:CR=1 FL=1
MLNFRKATENDTMLYFNWANDLNVRKHSFSSEEIDLKEHKTWFKAKLKDDTCLMLVFHNEENKNIGQIRIQKESQNQALIGISIAEDSRGKGYANEMLEMSSHYFFKFNKNYIINAFIKIDNLNSKFVFEKAGFEYQKELIYDNIKSFLYTKKINENR